MNNELVSKNKKLSPFLLTFLISGAFIVLIRLVINFSTPLIPGTNGAYYLVQVKSVVQTGTLAFADTPLVFWIEGGLAWAINLFVNNINSAVMISLKLFDSILPFLMSLPLILVLTKKYKETSPFSGISIVLLTSLHIFGLMMVSELQKNSLGNALMMFSICFIYLASTERKLLYWLAGLAFFVLTALAHIGSFSVLIVLVCGYALVYMIMAIKDLKKKWFLPVAVLVALALVAILLWKFMPEKFGLLDDVLSLPVKLFSNSWINSAFAFLSVPGARFPVIEFLSLTLNHLIVAISIVNHKKSWTQKDNSTKALSLSLAFAVLFFSSPLLGQDYAQRLFMVSYVPSIALALIFFLDDNKKVKTMTMVVPIVAFVCVSLLSMLQFRLMPAVTEDQVAEIESFGKKISGEKAIVVTKHGWEWWTAWLTGKPVLQQYHVDPGIWSQYQSVYYMKSTQSDVLFRISALQSFPEVDVPNDSIEYFKGEKIHAYKVIKPQEGARYGLPEAKGIVSEKLEGRLVMLTPTGKITIHLDNDTVVEKQASLEKGSALLVWGRRMLFVSDIKATRITKDNNPLPPPTRNGPSER